jgi:glutathione-independent formaldehyde dehydrogenase
MKMKALVYNGPKDVSVKEVPDAKIEKPADVLAEITTTAKTAGPRWC